jgi:hypothetical protein
MSSEEELERKINKLVVQQALLEQTVKDLKNDQTSKEAFTEKVQFFLVGGVISAVIAFVVKGGLSL